jgi:protein phosphatase
VRRAEAEAKKAIVNEKEYPMSPSTTMALAAFCRRRDSYDYAMVYAHVGDSRIYLLRANEELQRLTSDDGYFSLLLESGMLNESEAIRIDQAMRDDELDERERGYFDKRNGITQALGSSRLNIHFAQTDIRPGDRILLCTDGIHDNLRDVEIADLLKHGARTTAARLLVESAIKRSHEDGMIRAKADDMSAIVVTCMNR